MVENDISNQEEETKSKQKLGWFYRAVIWCSGVRLYILEQCPSDYNKFYGIGIIVIMTGVLASLSGGYALYTVFGKVWTAVVFGLVWGFMIFSLDWYIVSSLKKENRFYREFLSATPRIILAVLIGVVISKPLELKLFEKEIDQEIAKMQSENAIDYRSLVAQEFSEIDRRVQQNETLKQELNNKEEQRNRLFEMIVEEAEGRSPTNLVGKGPVYREKKQEFDKIQTEYNEIKERNLNQIDRNNEIIASLKLQEQTKVNQGDKVISNADGFLGRMNAIHRLTQTEKSIRNANLFIILLFIFIESAPMIVKLMSRRGAYDELLDSVEFGKHVEVEKDVVKNKVWEYDLSRYVEELNRLRAELKFDTDKKYVREVFESQYEIDQKKIEVWKKAQLEKIEKNLSQNLKAIDDLVKKDYKILPK